MQAPDLSYCIPASLAVTKGILVSFDSFLPLVDMLVENPILSIEFAPNMPIKHEESAAVMLAYR